VAINVPSSISNFERRPLPLVPWIKILGVALLALLALVLFMEYRLAQLGYRPTVHDSHARWAAERMRASHLGNRALIMIGASRLQVGVDIDTLRKQTGLEPVQLAIDSGAFAPVLAGLAQDPAIRGTVLVDYYDYAVGSNGGPAALYQRYYEKSGSKATGAPSDRVEKVLTEAVRENLSSYANEANPINSLMTRIFEGKVAQYPLITLPDRSRLADYSKVKMPEHYYQRVARTLGMDPQGSVTEAELMKKVSLQTPMSDKNFVESARATREMVAAIEARGGRVFFLAMPSSGMVRQIEERRYPRTRFWDQFVKEVGVRSLRSIDDPVLRNFTCPDGSHLDVRDRVAFTVEMSRALGLAAVRQDRMQ
jgi:hypothetical protein